MKRRILAWIMTFMIVFGTMPNNIWTASAADTADEPGMDQRHLNQIGNHYEVSQEDGSYSGDPKLDRFKEDGSSNTSVDNDTSTADNWKVKVDKTIEPTGTENMFNVTLSVQTKEELEKYQVSPDAAVVLVIDVSTSMKFCMEHNEEDSCGNMRITAAQKAAQDFINSYADASGLDAVRKISIVTFCRDGKVTQDWTDAENLVNTSGYCGPLQMHDGETTIYGDAGVTPWFDTNDLAMGSGTNIEAGLLLGRNLLESGSETGGEIAGIENKYVILLSDGAANSSVIDPDELTAYRVNYGNDAITTYDQDDIYDTNGNLISQYTGYWGNADYHFHHNGALEAATEIRNMGISFDTVYCGGENDPLTVGDPASENKDQTGVNCKYCAAAEAYWDSNETTPDIKVTEFLDDISDTYVTATNSSELYKAFEAIEKQIEIAAQAWKGTDPMGTNGQFSGIVSAGTSSDEYNATETNLVWDLLESDPVESGTEENKTYTYSITYKVRLNTLSDKYVADTYYATNSPTELKYYFTSSESEDIELQSIFFNIPSVKGYEGGYYSLNKVGENGEALKGAEFTLEHNCEICDACEGINCDDNPDNNSGTGCLETWSKTVSSDATGKVEFDNIPSGHNYILKETKAPAGFEASAETHELTVAYGEVTVDGKSEGDEGFNITVSNEELEYVVVNGSKTWNDENNKDGIRPDSITVNLFGTYELDDTTYYVQKDGTSVTTVAAFDTKNVSEADNWTWNWTELPKQINGHTVNWYVTEDDVEGYIPSYFEDNYNIKNTHVSDEAAYVGQKIWIGDNEEIRPDTLAIALYKINANGSKELVSSEPIWVNTDGDTWVFKFENITKYDDNGNVIQYEVVETIVPDGYIASSDVKEITSTNTVTGIDSLTRMTSDNTDGNFTHGNNQVGIIIADSSNSSTYQIWTTRDLTTQEEALVLEQIAQDTRYTNVTSNNVTFSSDNPKTYRNGNGNWSPRVEVSYTSSNRSVRINFTNTSNANVWDSWYFGSISFDQEYEAGTTTLTNTYETVDLEGSKTWSDNNDAYGTRPDSITLNIKNGNTIVETVEMTAGTDGIWQAEELSWKVEDLPKYGANGTEIEYTVEETTVPGYTTTYDGYDVTNTLNYEETPVHGSVTVNKKDYEDKSVSGATFGVFDNAECTGEPLFTMNGGTINLSTDDPELAAYLPDTDGETTLYLKETVAPSGYIKSDAVYTIKITKIEDGVFSDTGYVKNITYSITINGGESVNVVNNELTSATVKKVWNDNENQDGKRPSSLKVTLSNGTEVTLNEGNGWQATVDDLPKYDKDGNLITYTWTEGALPVGYGLEKTEVNGTVTTLTNKYPVELTSVTVKKVWDDDSDRDGKRPESLTVTLSNGTEVTLNEGNGWTGTVDDLPVYSNGKEIDYTWTEDTSELPEGYKLTNTETTTADGVETTVFTNSYTPAKTKVAVKKVWNDSNNQDGIRPAELKVTLSNGTEVTLNEENGWTAIVEDLPVYEKHGQKIMYTWTEDEESLPEGYELTNTTTTTLDGVDTTTFTNSYTPETTTVSVQKVWNDADNQDGKRPAEVTVQLMADGTAVGDPVELTGSGWNYTWNELPLKADGEIIKYTVVESEVEDYEASYSEMDENGKITVTNTHVPLVTSVTGTKTWDDENDRDGLRPDSVTIELYGQYTVVEDGKETTYYVTKDGDKFNVSTTKAAYATATVGNNGGNYSFTELPQYVDGHAITYTVTDSVAGYTPVVVGNDLVNKHEPAKTKVSVTKAWDDVSNVDGIRPDSVTVQLKANGVNKGEPVTLDATNGWSHTWEGLYVNYDKAPIEYTVVETDVPAGYEAKVTGNAADGFTVTNKHVPETTTATVKKVWDDKNNQDGKRPKSLTVTLSNGTSVTLNETNGWQATVDNLPKFETGKVGVPVVYSWTEGTMPAGYTLTNTETSNDGTITTLTNSYNTETTKATIVKVWNDGENQDGIRPASITADLMNGKTVVETVTLNAGNNWTATVDNLDAYANGQKITYTWAEGELPEGYELTDTSTNGTITTITNAHTPEVTTSSVQKVWDDAENQDGVRPETLVVTLSNGTEVTLSAANNWSATVENLPKYKDGKEIVYTWEEKNVPAGYTLVSTAKEGNLTTITNKHVPETTEATVKKIWSDKNNQDGKRPASLIVKLSNGTEVELNAANSWTGKVTDLPKYENGQEITYTWTEGTMPEGYELTGTSTNGTVTTLTNTYQPETTSATVRKVWDDSNNQDGKRPASLVVTLSNGQSVTLSEANNWTGTIEGLPVYADGEKITYTWTEAGLPEGYSLSGTATDGIITTLTNSYTTETTEATVQKVWDDNENQDGIRPASLTVTLSNGTEVTLSEANGWKATVEGLPKYENGVEINYTWSEGTAPAGYELTGTSKEGTVTTITNTHTPEVTSASVKKVWNDADNQDGNRPDSLTVELSNGTEVTLDESNGWSATVDNLPKYENGVEIVYTWEEESLPEGYTLTGTAKEGVITTLTNTDKADMTEATVVKVWNDAGNQDGVRPESLTVELLADGEETGKTVTLNEGNGWTATITELPVNNHGEAIEYTWAEGEMPEGYKLTDTSVNGTITTLTNSRTPEETEVTVVKVWDDAENQDGIRPASITATLSNGTEVTLSEANGWKATVEGLPKYENGVEINYTWTESEMPEGYKMTNTEVEGNVTTFTNKHTPETVEVNGSKTWADDNDRDGLRPASITIKLLADGEVVKTETVTAENGWAWSFKDLPKYRNGGILIAYTITEEAVAEYETEIDGYNVTNTHTPEQTSVSGTKTWNDADNQDGMRPESITVRLLADGVEVASKTVTAEDNWTYEFTELNKFRDSGVEIVYTVTEDAVKEYSTTVTGHDITNSYTPGETSVTVTKAWDDNGDQDGIRPDHVMVQLYADGQPSGEAVKVEAAKNWTYTWNGLAQKAAGKDIEYTVKEIGSVTGYTVVKTVEGDAATGYTITNKHEPETTSVEGTKAWNDANNQDGKRPESVTINLLANGELYASKVVTEKDNWNYKFENLPKYKAGVEIRYTITENPVENYTAKVDGFNVTNTHSPETVIVEGTKTWDDADNQDGFRPESITVKLLADGVEEQTKVVTAEDGWKYSFTNLPKYSNGVEIQYTIVESEVEEYVGNVNGANLFNTHVPKTTSIEGTKTWDDADNQDGFRPESITINLLADGVEVDEITLTEETDWNYKFENLPVYEAGKLITYTITEDAVDKYITTYPEKTYDVVNTHEPETVEVSGSKTWEDAGNQDGFRPESITINLLADGEVIDTVTVGETEGWAWNFTDLPKYENGKEIVYTVTEDEVKKYDTEINGYDVTNTHEPETVEVSGSKTWDDADNQDGKRPESITINLLANGKEIKSVTVGEADGWAWNFTNLPKYEAGAEIVYTITEDKVDGYTANYDGYDVTNSYTPGETSITVTKAWEDNGNQDGIRPGSVSVQLLADGVAKGDAVTLNAENSWTYTWTGLPEMAAGKDIEYTVAEPEVEKGYTVTVSGSEETGFIVTNTRAPEETEISVSKVWDDADDQDGVRPSSITYRLLANGVEVDAKTVTEELDWNWTFLAMPKYQDGKEIVYTVIEDEVEDYTTEITGNAADGFTVTNKHVPEVTSVEGTKTWNDNNNQDGKRPQSITVRLLADGEEIDTATVTEASGWEYSFTDLPKYRDGGVEIVYTVTEDEVEGYTTAIEGYDVTNTHTPETVDINGVKAWDDAENQDGVRPESVTVRLLANGEEVASKTVNAADNWKYSFTGMPKYADGELILYTVTEDAVSDYGSEIDGFYVENTHTPGKTSVSVSKVWDDANNQDGKRPESVTVRLLANGVEKEAVELNAENAWKHTWTDLDEKADGKVIAYTVSEDEVKNYTTDIDGDAKEGYTVTNTHTPEVVTLSGAKTWTDADDQDGKRPDSITINLLANGIQVDTVTVSEDDGWDWSFADKPKYENGVAIVYTIQEILFEDYTTSISGYDVVNTHIPETTSVHVDKNWNDKEDQDGIRPASITYNLLANGEVVQSRTVTAADRWKAEFTELPVYEGGEKITYTVSEEPIEGYTSTVIEKEDDPGNFVVSNTHEVEKTSVKGKKSWKDKFDQDGKRPDSITVYLLANGERIDSKVVTKADDWKYEFTDLNKNAKGEEIVYTVEEEAVPKYSAEVDGFNIENTYVPETTEVSVAKTWADADDQDGKRPESITINLLADGKVVDTEEVTAVTDWTHTFTDLPKYRNGGKLIVYTITEDAVAEYETEIAGSAEKGYDVTNTHTPETVDVDGTKTWDDAEDQDGKRPESITINLLADGKVVKTETVTAEDDWSWSFKGLPKYKDGAVIEYATAEVAIDDYSTTITNYNVTNAHTPDQTSVSVSKVWDDAGNQDGIRPSVAKIQLLADGEVIRTAELNADNGWAHTWSELDMYDDGDVIKYTVKEVDVKAGYEVAIKGNATDGYVVTNTHEPETTEVSGTKTWADVNDQDGKRPDEITVLLLKNGDQIDSTVVSEENGWDWTFKDLPKFENGKEIVYQIEEVVITDYETSIDQNTGEIVNKHDPETTFVQVAKSWWDRGDQDGIRPDKITVNLLADGKKIDSKIVTAADDWTTQFTNLPKYKDGELIKYTVTEEKVKGYETSYVEYKDYQVIVNVHKPETTSVEGTKTWDDANNQDGVRPESIIVNLYADGVKVDEKTVTGADNWAYNFNDLPKFADGKEIAYTVDEVPVDGYETTVDGYDITNTHDVERINIKGTKTWNDEDDQDGKRPESLTVQLRVNGQVWDSKVVTAEDNWTYEWKDLSKYYNGKEIKYTVTEKLIPGYTVSHDGYNITNSYTPGIVDVHVTKGWKDLNDQDGIRPESVEVELYADGVATGKVITLSHENGWHADFDDLDEYADGEKINYTVKEVNVAEGYESVVSGTLEEGFTILNTHDPEQIEIKGAKTWDDADDQDGKRPESITVTLLANGEAIDSKVVTADDDWKYNFGQLDKYYNGGKEIKYEVKESKVEGYKADINGLDITNTHVPETKDIEGSKTWDDNFDQDGMRPEEITVKLLADGEVADTVTVTEKDGWAWAFEDVPVYKDGKVIEYTVDEGVVRGYEPVVEGYDITNVHEPATTEIKGSKTWDDADDQDGKRPEKITVRLLADGKEVAADVVSEDNGWTWFFEDLPVYDDGEIIEYTVEESTVDGYKPVVNGYDITNVHEPEVTSIEGSKTWDDADNQDGKRPEVIKVNLLANGEVVDTANVTAANAWEWIFKDLPVYEDGEKITYTIEEEAVEGYTSTYDGFDITNTHEPETVDVKGSKTWDDADDQDGIRPDEIKVRLLADGTEVDTMKVTAADDWSWNFKDLPKYKDGKEIVYTITEDAVDNYGPAIDGYDITNSYTPEQTSVTVTKAWDDADNQDGVRPELIEVQLYADGEAYDVPKVLYAENNWTYTWTELDMNDGGEPVEYTVKEVDLDEDNYTCEITGDAVEGYIITNTHEPETMDIEGSKTWLDNDDEKGLRPGSIMINLLADGELIEVREITAESGWAWTFEDVPVYADGKAIEYTVTEEAVEGYNTTVDGYNVTNELKDAADIALEANKTLKDADLEAEQFEFGMYDAEGELIQTAANDESGTIAFESFELREEGTHEFFIQEIVPEDAEEIETGVFIKDGIVYDDTVYKYTVEIALDENGDFTIENAAIEYADGEAWIAADSMEFVNQYTGGSADDGGDGDDEEEEPEKPTPPGPGPDDPLDEDDDSDKTTQTGDTFNVLFWMMLALAGAGGAATTLTFRRKRTE